MEKNSSKGLKVGIFGLGKSNLAVLDYLKSCGISFSLTLRSNKTLSNFSEISAEHIYWGENAYKSICEDILFLSPSVRRDKEELAEASEKGVILSSDAELFFKKNNFPVYAVTGSDGKSTTSYLISSMLTASGKKSIPAGNFGLPLCKALSEGCITVAELSSFQLMDILPKSRRAVITNITPNHLDWHKDFEEYISAKLNIARNSDGLIIDYDSKILRKAVSEYKLFAAVSQKYRFHELKNLIHAENYITADNEAVYMNGIKYFSLKNVIRNESYNIKNFMLSSAAVIGEARPSAIEEAIRAFGGLPHRKETVCVRDGITYINSSIDSTPERTLNTLRCLSGRVSVIIGGRGKGLSLKRLAEELPHLTVGACLMGEVGQELSFMLKDNTSYKTLTANNMKDAVKASASFLHGSGTVILSPAATSFDKYENFEKRGEDFKSNCPGK